MSDQSISVAIDTSPLGNANAIRGVGVYTRYLTEAMQHLKNISVTRTVQAKSTTEPDIIHYPYFDLFFSTLPLLQKKPFVVTVHDVIPLRYPDYYPVGVKGTLWLQKQTLALKRAKRIITDSQTSKQDISEFLKIKPDMIEVVQLAGNPEIKPIEVQAQIEKIRKEYQIKPNYILYVGDINYNKNIPQLVKALKFLPDKVQLVLVGKNFKEQDIPEWQAISAQIALSDVADRVTMITDLGSDATHILSCLYSGAVAYIQPSLWEGFGLPVVEAMQTGTPVIASSTPALVELSDQIIFSEPSAEKFAEKILTVLDLSERKRAAVAKKLISEAARYSWQKTAIQTAQVYKTVLSS